MRTFALDKAYAILDPMKGGPKANGFTIVETMIVIAVSGFIFVGVVLLIAGQQGKTQFQQSINAVAQQLQQTIGDVSNGYYPTNNIKCSTGGPASKPLLKAGGGSIGTNPDCVLVGKVIQFMSTANSNDQQKYIVYSMAGLRQYAGQNITNLTDANPIAIAPGNGIYSSVPDASVVSVLTNGLSVVNTTYKASSLPQKDVAFAVLAVPSNSTGTSGGSATQQIGLYAVKGTNIGQTSANNVDQIDNFSNFVSASEFTVCLASGTTNQSGLITIGGNGRQLSVVLAIKEGTKC